MSGETVTKKLYVKTYGCQMNVYDSTRIESLLARDGYVTTDRPDEADMIVLNTCHIREKAAEKVYSELGRLKPLKSAKPELKIAVAGCVAQAEGEEIVRRQPAVDLVVGPQAYHRLPKMIAESVPGRAVVETEFPEEDKFDHLPQQRVAPRAPTAFLTVQEGCDKFCAFCVVPYTRGAEVSRSPDKILSEARSLVEQGVAEITLLGQNVNAYHGEATDGVWSLARLIRALAGIDGLERLRYTTSHPNDMTDDLIAAHGEIGKLMPFLHLPVQSGSDSILKAMNRRHTAKSYLDLIARIRESRPDIAMSGDFIVGFPGETDADFEQTLQLCEEVQYAQAFSFKYSARPGTPAAERPLVDADVASARLARLQETLGRHQSAFQDGLIGQALPVLFEKAGREPGQVIGRSPYLQPVVVDAPETLIGTVRQVQITRTNTNSLVGELTAADI